MAFTFNQTPGTPADSTASGTAQNVDNLILAELRVISFILAQMNPGIVLPFDLDNMRADPTSIQQRLS